MSQLLFSPERIERSNCMGGVQSPVLQVMSYVASPPSRGIKTCSPEALAGGPGEAPPEALGVTTF